MNMKSFTLKMDDGYELCLNRWIPDSEEDIKAGRVYGPFNSVDDLIADLEKDD